MGWYKKLTILERLTFWGILALFYLTFSARTVDVRPFQARLRPELFETMCMLGLQFIATTTVLSFTFRDKGNGYVYVPDVELPLWFLGFFWFYRISGIQYFHELGHPALGYLQVVGIIAIFGTTFDLLILPIYNQIFRRTSQNPDSV